MRSLVLAVLVAAAPAPLLAQSSRLWRPEERTVISDFAHVTALAASQTHLFVATRTGLGIYDRRFRRWEPPVTAIDGYPREPVLAALADPTDDAVWLGTATGLLRYRLILRQFETMVVPGGVRDLMYDREDPFAGIYLRTARDWEQLPTGSFISQPTRTLPPAHRRVGPLSVEQLLRRQPIADAMRAAVLTDDRLRTFRYTAAVQAPLGDVFFLGTDGRGVMRLDAAVALFEPLPFGLLARGVGAVLAVPGGVWVGTDAGSRRAGLAFVADDLQEYRYEEGPRATGLAIRETRDLIGRGPDVLAATDRGVIRFEPDGTTRSVTRSHGLPHDETYALAQGPSGVWVGTRFGLGFIPEGGEARALGGDARIAVLSLAAARDSAWVGTTQGLGRAGPEGDLVVPPDVAAVHELRTAIVALALAADTIVAATVERVIWRAPDASWQLERVIAAEIGALFALAADSGGVWLGGDRGIAFFRFATREFRIFTTPGDVPGPVRDLTVAGPYLWVATAEGLVRFARGALLP